MDTVTAPREAIAQHLLDALAADAPVICLPHAAADGDALGACMGLALALEALGGRAIVLADEAFPSTLSFVVGKESVQIYDEKVHALEGAVLILMDCHEAERLGRRQSLVDQASLVLRVDHHRTLLVNDDKVWIDPERAATCEMAYELIRSLEAISGKSLINQSIAEHLSMGIYTDTGSLQYASTTASTYRILAELMPYAPRNARMAEAIFAQMSLPVARVLGLALSRARWSPDGRLAMLLLDEEDLASCEAGLPELSGIGARLRSVVGTELSVFLVLDRSQGLLKASLRASQEVDASRLARAFGGGGHKAAAGFRLEGVLDLDRKAEAIFEAARAYLSGKMPPNEE